MQMPEPISYPSALDAPVRLVFTDRPLIDRIARSIALDQSVSYADALQQLHDAVDQSHQFGGDGTLRAALSHIGDPDDINASLTLLEQRDHAVDDAYQQQAGPTLLEQDLDARGMVRLDADAAARLLAADQATFERRLMTTRELAPNQWLGDQGREAFRKLDRELLEQQLDMVATYERPRQLAQARQHAGGVARTLDQALKDGADHKHRLKLLDREVEQLTGRRRELETTQPQAGTSGPESNTVGLRLLDDDTGGASVGKSLSPKAREIAARINAQEPRDRQHYLQLLSADSSATAADATPYTEVVLRVLDTPAPPKREPEPTPAPSERMPPGVHPGSHQLDQRVRERMRQLHRGESDYVRTLEEVIGDDAA